MGSPALIISAAQKVLCQHMVSVVCHKPVPEPQLCQADIQSLEYSMNKYLQYLLTAGSSGNSLKFWTSWEVNLGFVWIAGCEAPAGEATSPERLPLSAIHLT